MHPDQATESIVDFALEYKKPFAIVPCCVFNRLFPDRKTKDGKEVIQYNDFIDYLLQKNNEIQLSYLPFEGRNKVLYKL